MVARLDGNDLRKIAKQLERIADALNRAYPKNPVLKAKEWIENKTGKSE